jgi:hypothetical protein
VVALSSLLTLVVRRGSSLHSLPTKLIDEPMQQIIDARLVNVPLAGALGVAQSQTSAFAERLRRQAAQVEIVECALGLVE